LHVLGLGRDSHGDRIDRVEPDLAR
jgi:hypothetical protein